MIRKLLSQLKYFFSKAKYVLSDPRVKRRLRNEPKFDSPGATGNDEFLQSLQSKFKESELDQIVEQNQKNFEQPPQVQLNLDTGKIILPDNLSAEDKSAVEEALAELQKSLQNMTSDQFQSLEDFLKENGATGGGYEIPFTVANNIPEAQNKILEEMGNCKDDTEHWSDADFVEALFGFYNQGYEFEGIEDMANKVNEKLELTKNEQKQLRDWYMLASQELVYDV